VRYHKEKEGNEKKTFRAFGNWLSPPKLNRKSPVRKRKESKGTDEGNQSLRGAVSLKGKLEEKNRKK